jgi:adenosylmethionine-8-amino-7-oxononanoate aminotransferase
MFGAERYGYVPDMITCAKGITSGYAPLGAVLCRDFLAEPFLEGKASFAHGLTFAGHPVSCAVSLANLDVFEREDLLAHVRRYEPELRSRLQELRDLPIVGDVRGAGYFWAVELVKDKATKETFTPDEREHLLRGFLLPRFLEAGLIVRVDDRGEPIVQLSPPLIAGPEEFDFMVATIREHLAAVGEQFR